MDIQKEWDLFVAHLRTLGVVKIGRNALGVILYPGCVEALLEKETALALTREILNVFYGYYEVHEVSSLPLFAKYLELIS